MQATQMQSSMSVPEATPTIESQKTECSVIKTFQNNCRNQKTRDHKEHVNADEATFNPRREGMKTNDQQDRYSSQSIYVRPITRMS